MPEEPSQQQLEYFDKKTQMVGRKSLKGFFLICSRG
jgi:hypothetical protein